MKKRAKVRQKVKSASVPPPETPRQAPERAPPYGLIAAIVSASEKLDKTNRPHAPPQRCKCGFGRWYKLPLTGRSPAWRCAMCGDFYVDGIPASERLSKGHLLYAQYQIALHRARTAPDLEIPGVPADVRCLARSWADLTGGEQIAWNYVAGEEVVFNPLTGEKWQKDHVTVIDPDDFDDDREHQR